MERAVNRLIVVFGALAALFAAGAYFFRGAPHGTAYEDELETAVCDYIDIDVLRLDVTVLPYDGDDIIIKYRNDLPLTFEKGDNTLYISESDEFVISLLSGRERFGMYVYLPRTIYREITVYTGSGSVMLGASVTIPISDGRLELGPRQYIMYADFDGCREKSVIVKIIGE